MGYLFIGILGVFGVFCRYFIDLIFSRLPIPFPFGTLFINLLGSFLAGLIYVFGVERSHLPADLRTGILVGFLGGFTTFSAYALQSAQMIGSGLAWLGLSYLILSPALGLACAFLGIMLGRQWG